MKTETEQELKNTNPLYKEFQKCLKGHKVLKGNYLTVVKEIKRASSK